MTAKQMEQWLKQRGLLWVIQQGQMFVAHLKDAQGEDVSAGHTREDAIEALYNWVSRLEK